MKKAISLFTTILFITFICSNLFAEDKLSCEESMEKGAEAAEVEHRPGLWFGIGVAAGVEGVFIGTIIVAAIASSITPHPAYIPNENILDENCYIRGYSEVAKRKNTRNAVGGGILGTVAIVATIGILYASTY